jgi:hypothetical protein
MQLVSDSIVSGLTLLRGTYFGGASVEEEEMAPVVSLLSMLASQSAPFIGRLQPKSLQLLSTTRLSTETIMHHYSLLRAIDDNARLAGSVPDLANLTRFYVRKIAAVLSKIAAQSLAIADFYDVTPWGDVLASPA